MARRVGWVLIWGALLIFAFLGYQLFVTDLLNDRVQTEAKAELEENLAERRVTLPEPEPVTTTVPETDDTPTSDVPTVTTPDVELVPEEAGEEGEALGRLVIPSLDVDEVIFEGVTRDTLKKGPGHMPATPVPGQVGNAVLSGHRTTYGRPFYALDELEEGDRIEVETATGLHVYEVRRSIIVEPTDVWVADHIDGSWLTLTTCHPRFSAAERLIIQAELVEGPNLEYVNFIGDRNRFNEEAA